MNIISPGSEVVIDFMSDICGTICEVLIGNNNIVRYKVSWWNGRARHCEWFDSFEVKINDKTVEKTIGFKCPGNV